jgi:uncharacterized membrane protein YphA (DoxX/SURF4 family)
MSTITTSAATTLVRRSGWARVARVGLWAVRLLLVVQFVMGGMLKLTGNPQMVAMFDDIGAGQWLRLLVGVCEVAGGIGVLVPRLARPAAIALAVLLGNAAVTNVVILEASPAVPLVLLAMSVLVAIRMGEGNGR